MSRFTKKVLLPITEEMYSELLARSLRNGTSVNAEIRTAVGSTIQHDIKPIADSKPAVSVNSTAVDDIDWPTEE